MWSVVWESITRDQERSFMVIGLILRGDEWKFHRKLLKDGLLKLVVIIDIHKLITDIGEWIMALCLWFIDIDQIPSNDINYRYRYNSEL